MFNMKLPLPLIKIRLTVKTPYFISHNACAYILAIVFQICIGNFVHAATAETATLLETSHSTTWAYFRNEQKENAQWYIANSNGIVYSLGTNSSGHAAWEQLANGTPVATVDFSTKTVSLSSSIGQMTSSGSYVTKSLVAGEADQYIYGSRAYSNANLIAGKTLKADWYFFQVASTQKWYIIWTDNKSSQIKRLELNALKNNYNWQNPLDSFKTGVDTSGWFKEFILNNGSWKVQFGQPTLIYPFKRMDDWQICQGYNTPSVSHKGTLVYSLDFAYGLKNQGSTACYGTQDITAGKEYISPGTGTIGGRDFGNDTDVSCLVLDVPVPNGLGSLVRSVEMGHLKTGSANRRLTVGTKVSKGEVVGLICDAGTCSSMGSYAHAHMGVYTTVDCSGTTVPFGTVFGESFNFTSDGSKYQWHTTNILKQ
jgi:hypothetical protein